MLLLGARDLILLYGNWQDSAHFRVKNMSSYNGQTWNMRNGLKGVNIFKNDHCLRRNANSQKFWILPRLGIAGQPIWKKCKCQHSVVRQAGGNLKDIHQRIPTEDEEIIARGDHNKAFNVVLQEICFTQSVDFWIREVVSTYQMVIKNIYFYKGDIDGNLIDYL